MKDFAFGHVENGGPKDRHKFDCIEFNESLSVFTLCDGANSTPWGGHAATLAASLFTNFFECSNSLSKNLLIESYSRVNSTVTNKIQAGATTAINILLSSSGIYGGSCGDSLIEVYKLRQLMGWKKNAESILDLLPDQKGPSQLIGCNAYHSVNTFELPPEGSYIILMMSDGVYKFIPESTRLKLISKVSRNTPSNDDMQYISNEFCEFALKNGSNDDLSIVSMWVRFN